MVRKSIAWKILPKLLPLLLAAAVLAGCGAGPTVAPTFTQAPTTDPRPTFDAIASQAAQTVIAELTVNAPPTNTPVPPTETPVPPTATPAVTDTPAPTSTPTRVFIPWTLTPTATQPAYGCTVTNVTPKSSDTIKVDQEFDAAWTVQNTGTQPWLAGNTDIAFVGGAALHDRPSDSSDLRDLTSDVAPNGTYTVTIDMQAPSGDGTHTTSWAIQLEGGATCQLNLTINVTR